MKECPFCRSRYTDVTLRFCLADGTQLVDIPRDPTSEARDFHAEETIAMRGDPETIVSRGSTDTMQHSAGTDTGRPAAATGSSISLVKVLAAAVVVLLGGLVLLGGAGVAFYLWSRSAEPAGRSSEIAVGSPTPAAADSPGPSPAAEGDPDVPDELAEFERMLDDSQANDTTPEWPITLPGYSTTTRTAVVNSPRDGFLSLRSMPNADIGERLAQIPHGEELTVGTCLLDATVSGRKGKWCLAKYDDETGWVFDGFVTYQSGSPTK